MYFGKVFRVLSVVAFLGSFAVHGYGAMPKAADEAAVMPEVVVTATRDSEEVRRVPANVSVITAKQIENSGATTIVEALEKLESINFVDYTGTGSKTSIDMRGFGGDSPYGKTLVMLDGRRLNRPDMSSANWLQIPLNNVERIEVVRGAGSVLYGDAAVGGVINIITKKGEGKPKFNASVIAGSYGLHDERVSFAGTSEKWSYALTGENNYNSGYRDRSKLSSQGGSFDVGYEASELFNVSLGGGFNKTDYQLPGALTKAQMEQDRRQYQPAGLWTPASSDDDGADNYTDLNLGVRSYLGPWGEMSVNFLYGKKELQANMPSWWGHYSDTGIDTYGITPKYILEKDVFGFGNKLLLGIDYYRESYSKEFFTTRERAVTQSWADLARDSLGYYIRDEFSVVKNLILHAGYRYERANLEGDNTDSVTPANNFSGKDKNYSVEAYEGGATWLFGKQSKMFAKYATVYRIPFLDEIAYFNGFGGGFLADLEEERGASIEVGTEFYPLKDLKIGLTMFRVDMEDEIVYTGVFPTGQNENTGKTRHDGAEISLSYLLGKKAKIYGNFTYHKATFENGANNKKEIPMVPNRMANAGAEIYLPFNVTLRPEIRYAGDSYLGGDNDNSTEKLESRTLFNLYLYYRPTFGKIKTTLFLGAENLTDQKYSSYGYDGGAWSPNTYYPMPGIVFKGGLSCEF
ncbi:MAG: TonB-dependent receptor [Syntrophales bacterium]|jgi:iron complex outermembrane receptor protein|nr:TonB-dependent receptor [Syntrophales bacterium]